ncbi:MAG: TonB-dependent receptor [Myxococcales bacterium]|nr:TonB-dependent receptor [Myxococcales bacterium]
MRTIPELLRLVPGVQVAQLSSSQYAISVRGFNGNFSDKLLVLIDGRSVYTPLFAGVFWDVQDLPLANIDRIEVIRGQGGTVWGANAVNGVINIVTKSAADTPGWHVETGVGSYEKPGAGVVQYGGSLAKDVHFRVYLKHFDRERFKLGKNNQEGSIPPHDAWDQVRTGFRLDAKVGKSGEFTLQGDLYKGSDDGTVAGSEGSFKLGGGNLLSRYTHKFSDTHNASVQFYYDRTDRNSNILNYELDTFDLELKHQIAPFPWLDLVWGGEYRHRSDSSQTSNPAAFTPVPSLGLFDVLTITPPSRNFDLLSGFVQAEARTWEDKLRFTLGTKLEDNDMSGFEIQPSLRFAFIPNETMTVWGSVSRAVHTPSRARDDASTINIVENPLLGDSRFIATQNSGTRNLEAENLMAYEAGVRLQPTDWIHLDLAAYYNDYNDLNISDVASVPVNLSAAMTGTVPITVINRIYTNHGSGVAWGFEFFARVQVLEDHAIVKKWWIDATYSYIDVDADRDAGNHIGNLLDGEGNPIGRDEEQDRGRTESHHTIGLRSHMNFPYDVEFDTAYWYVSKVAMVGKQKVAGYHRFDLRTAWRPSENVEVSFTVENLFDAGHDEWNSELFISGTKIPRAFYTKIVLNF